MERITKYPHLTFKVVTATVTKSLLIFYFPKKLLKQTVAT